MMRSFSIYLVVQGVSYGIDLGLFLLLHGVVGLNPILANVIGKLNATVFSFCLNRWVTFASNGNIAYQAVLFSTFSLLNIAVASLLLQLLSSVISDIRLAKVLTDVLLFSVSYTISKTITFRKRPT